MCASVASAIALIHLRSEGIAIGRDRFGRAERELQFPNSTPIFVFRLGRNFDGPFTNLSTQQLQHHPHLIRSQLSVCSDYSAVAQNALIELIAVR